MSRSSLRSVIAVTAVMLSVSLAEAQTPMVASTRDFITAAAHSDQFEILEGRTALTQTSDPRIRAFAKEMVQAHTATSRTLKRAAMKAGMDTLPKGLDGDQQKLLSALQSQRGTDFDRTYIKQQVLAHQQALVVEEAYAGHGANPDVQQAATSAVPVIEHHLRMADQLRGELAAAR